jgi:hypothetical protein
LVVFLPVFSQQAERKLPMPDTLNYYQLIQQSLADSSLRTNYFKGEFIGSFIQSSTHEIVPALNTPSSTDYISYILLFLITGIALIWSFMPERLFSVFNISTKKGFSRKGDAAIKTPGLAISLFFFLNFIFNFSIFLFLLLKNLAPELVPGMNSLMIIAYIVVAILIFYLFRLLYIRSSGFIFRTNEKSRQQLNIYINTENAFGILLIPILMLSLYTSYQYVLFAGILLFIIFLVIRWIKTFFIGISIGGFTVLHLILYLCTLEIIPVLIVIKLVEYGGIN